MAEAVIDLNEVSLNAVRYPIVGPVRRALSTNYPGKVVTGDTSRDSHPTLSVLALSDHRGGIGLDVMKSGGQADRSWYSTADLRFDGRLILPPLVTSPGGLPAGSSSNVHFGEFKGEVYALFTAATSPGIYKYDDSGDTWGSRLHTMASAGWDVATGGVGGTNYIFFAVNIANTANVIYTSDGSSFSTLNVTGTPVSIAIWDGKLWVLNSTGQMYYFTAVGASQVTDAKLDINTGSLPVGHLIVGRNAVGDFILYALTSEGIYAHDFDNSAFILTDVRVPDRRTSSTNPALSGISWQGDIYFSAGPNILKYQPGNTAVLSVVGPDKDDGLPSGYAASPSHMLSSLTDLIVATSGTSTNQGTLLAFNQLGWRVLVELGQSEYFQTQYRRNVLVSGAYGDYRLWYFYNAVNSVRYIKLPNSLISPLKNSSYTYAAAATHDWPWFTAGQSEVTKVAVRVRVETLNPTSTETVILSYATDYVESFTAFATITTAGITTFPFPNSSTPTGTEFKAIRFRAALARGSTNTRTPQVISVTLEYYKKLDEKYQFTVALDLNQDYKGNTVKQLRAALLTAIETKTLVEFAYRDPAANADATFYVQVQSPTSMELTGYDERGQTLLHLVEV